MKHQFKTTFVAAALCAIAPLSNASTYGSKVFPNGFGITIEGKLEKGDGQKFVAYYTRLAAKLRKPLTSITLNSPGGNIADAWKIGTIIQTTGATTQVRGGTCASACFLIWAAGKRRLADPLSLLGVHTVVDLTRDRTPEVKQNERVMTEKLAMLFNLWRVPGPVIQEMQTTQWPATHWLTKDEIAASILTTPVAPSPQKFTPPSTLVPAGSFMPPAAPLRTGSFISH
jgi:Clp protease